MFNRSSATNFTVYCGGISDSDENSIRRVFSQYGRIMEIRYFKDKGYAFIRYDNKESACSAIVAVHCTDIDGQNVKCSWGKENPGSSNPGSNMPNQGMHNSSNSPNPSNSSIPANPSNPYKFCLSCKSLPNVLQSCTSCQFCFLPSALQLCAGCEFP